MARPGGLAGRRRQPPHAGGSVLDFGRYAGWTVGSLAGHDPDYLEWLARTPIGRRLAAEIHEALATTRGRGTSTRADRTAAIAASGVPLT